MQVSQDAQPLLSIHLAWQTLKACQRMQQQHAEAHNIGSVCSFGMFSPRMVRSFGSFSLRTYPGITCWREGIRPALVPWYIFSYTLLHLARRTHSFAWISWQDYSKLIFIFLIGPDFAALCALAAMLQTTLKISLTKALNGIEMCFVSERRHSAPKGSELTKLFCTGAVAKITEVWQLCESTSAMALKSRILWLMHWSAALNIQAAPVEVVTCRLQIRSV